MRAAIAEQKFPLTKIYYRKLLIKILYILNI